MPEIFAVCFALIVFALILSVFGLFLGFINKRRKRKDVFKRAMQWGKGDVE